MPTVLNRSILPNLRTPENTFTGFQTPKLKGLVSNLKSSSVQPRIVTCPAHFDARHPNAGDHTGTNWTPPSKTLLSPKLAHYLKTELFKQLANRCPAGFVILNQKNMLEILSLDSLTNADTRFLSTETAALSPKQKPSQQQTQVFIQMDPAFPEVRLFVQEVRLLARVIQEMRTNTQNEALLKIGLAPQSADFFKIQNYTKSRFEDISSQANALIEQQFDQEASPLVIDLTQEARNARRQLIAFVLENPNTQTLQFAINYACEKVSRDQNIEQQDFLFSQAGLDIIELLSTVLVDLYHKEAHALAPSCLVNFPLSEPEKMKLKKSILGATTSHALRQLEIQKNRLPLPQTSIIDQSQNAQNNAPALANTIGPFRVSMTADGIPWAETHIDPTLDQLEPFLSTLFDNTPVFNSALITQAQTFANPDYDRVPLHNEIRLFIQEQLTQKFAQSSGLQFTASMGYLFNWTVERSLHRQELAQDRAQTLQLHLQNYVSHCLSEELSLIDFFEEQPAIIQQSNFAQTLYLKTFDAVAAGQLKIDSDFQKNIKDLLQQISHQFMSERLR